MNEESEIKRIPHGFVRVSDVLKPYSDFTAIDPKVLANAAARGTRVHALCESYALDLFVPSIDDDVKNYFERYVEWFDFAIDRVIHCEIRMNNTNLRLSGGCDLIAVLKGDKHPSIIDIKTPAVASNSWQLQTAAYQILARDCLGIESKRRLCVMLPKIGSKAHIIEYCDHTKDENLFLKALELYRFFKC